MAAISAITSSSVRRLGAHGARAGHVAHRAVAHRGREHLLAVAPRQELGRRVEHPVALEHLALVREVDRGDLEVLAADVLPHVQLGPVRDREHAHVLARPHAAVVEVPQLGPLAPRVPLAEVVAEGEDPLLRARPLLVAPGAAEGGVEAVLVDRVEQRHRLQPVARRLVAHAPAVDRLLHRGDEHVRHAAVAELDRLREVVAGVDVHDRKRDVARPERLLGQPQQHDRVLAAAEQQHRPLELGRHLADDVDRLRLEHLEMRGDRGASRRGLDRRAAAQRRRRPRARARSGRRPARRPAARARPCSAARGRRPAARRRARRAAGPAACGWRCASRTTRRGSSRSGASPPARSRRCPRPRGRARRPTAGRRRARRRCPPRGAG